MYFSISVNSLSWAPHELGAILACASSDGKISVLTFKSIVLKNLSIPFNWNFFFKMTVNGMPTSSLDMVLVAMPFHGHPHLSLALLSHHNRPSLQVNLSHMPPLNVSLPEEWTPWSKSGVSMKNQSPGLRKRPYTDIPTLYAIFLGHRILDFHARTSRLLLMIRRW